MKAWISTPMAAFVGAHLPPSVQRVLDALPSHVAEPRSLVGILGIALLVAGSRFYRIAIIAPGFLAGVWVAQRLQDKFPGILAMGVGLVLGLGGALLCYLLERAAVRLVGAVLVSGVVHAVGPVIWHTEPPFWFAPAAGLVGLALFPSIYQKFLPLIGAVLGALCVAWSLDRIHELPLVGVLALGGLILQVVWRMISAPSNAKPDKKGK